MAEKTARNAAEATSDSKVPTRDRKKLLLIGLLVVVLLGAGIGLGFLFGNRSAAPESPAADVSSARQPAIYVSLGDTFLVMLSHQGRQHYCKAALSALVRDQEVVEQLKVHAPLIRGRLNSLIGEQDFAVLRTDEGRQTLRSRILATVQEILQREMGRPGVEQVFFTELVLQ